MLEGSWGCQRGSILGTWVYGQVNFFHQVYLSRYRKFRYPLRSSVNKLVIPGLLVVAKFLLESSFIRLLPLSAMSSATETGRLADETIGPETDLGEGRSIGL